MKLFVLSLLAIQIVFNLEMVSAWVGNSDKCETPSGKKLELDEKVTEDDVQYWCIKKSQNEQFMSISQQPDFYIDVGSLAKCQTPSGKTLKVDESVVEGDFQYDCAEKGENELMHVTQICKSTQPCYAT